MVECKTIERVVCALFLCVARSLVFGADGLGQPIEFSKPDIPLVTTNLQPSTPTKLDETFLKQRGFLGAGSKFAAPEVDAGVGMGRRLPVPAFISPDQRNRVREYLERRRNWVYLTAEELGLLWTTEEKLGLSRLEQTPSRAQNESVIGRFYQRLKQESEARTGQVLPDLIGENATLDFNAETSVKSPIVRKLDEVEQNLQNLFKSQPAGDLLPMPEQKNSFSVFEEQPWTMTIPTQADLDRKSRLDEFKRLLEPAQAPAAVSPRSSPVGSLGEKSKTSTSLNTPIMGLTSGSSGTSVGTAGLNPYSATTIRPGTSTTLNQPLNLLPATRERSNPLQPPTGPPRREF